MIDWTPEDDAASEKQGWAIFDTTSGHGHPPWELHRIDDPEDGSEPLFEGDRQAHEFVLEQSMRGDRLAYKALEFLREHSPKEYDTVTKKRHKGWK